MNANGPIGVTPRKQVEVAIAVIVDPATGLLLICQRKADTVLGGYWEFPGGKCHADEPPERCVLRETLEETGLTIRAIRRLAVIEHEYPHARVRLHAFLCERLAGELQLLAIADAQWIKPADVEQYRFPEANTPLLREIAAGRIAITAS